MRYLQRDECQQPAASTVTELEKAGLAADARRRLLLDSGTALASDRQSANGVTVPVLPPILIGERRSCTESGRCVVQFVSEPVKSEGRLKLQAGMIPRRIEEDDWLVWVTLA